MTFATASPLELTLPAERKTLQELRHSHKEITRLVLAGMSQTEIAEQLGMSFVAVNRIMGDPLFKANLARLQQKADDEAVDIRKKIAQIAPRALMKLETLMEQAQKEEIQYKAAVDILDRAGYKPVERTMGLNLNVAIEKGDLEDIQKRFSAARAGGLVVSQGGCTAPHEGADERSVAVGPGGLGASVVVELNYGGQPQGV